MIRVSIAQSIAAEAEDDRALAAELRSYAKKRDELSGAGFPDPMPLLNAEFARFGGPCPRWQENVTGYYLSVLADRGELRPLAEAVEQEGALAAYTKAFPPAESLAEPEPGL